MQEFPSWLPTVVLITAAFLIGRWTARSSGRAPERYEAAPKPPYHPSSTSRSGAGVDGVSSGWPDGDLEKELQALAKNGQKIEAIKLARVRLGLGLKEAKDLVESL